MGLNGTNTFNKKIEQILNRKIFKFEVLGKVNHKEDDIILIYKKNSSKCPNLLIAAGFHGNEKAGTLAILKFLLTVKEQVKRS